MGQFSMIIFRDPGSALSANQQSQPGSSLAGSSASRPVVVRPCSIAPCDLMPCLTGKQIAIDMVVSAATVSRVSCVQPRVLLVATDFILYGMTEMQKPVAFAIAGFLFARAKLKYRAGTIVQYNRSEKQLVLVQIERDWQSGKYLGFSHDR